MSCLTVGTGGSGYNARIIMLCTCTELRSTFVSIYKIVFPSGGGSQFGESVIASSQNCFPSCFCAGCGHATLWFVVVVVVRVQWM